MDKVILNVLAAPRLVPLNTCSCAKGIAKGLQLVTASVPGLLPNLLKAPVTDYVVAPIATPARKVLAAASTSHNLKDNTQPAGQLPSLLVPDLELAALGEVNAREQHYIAMLSAMNR
eukprot:XP_001702689.1 predicted protein [Chlamydomonas reinhardtii]